MLITFSHFHDPETSKVSCSPRVCPREQVIWASASEKVGCSPSGNRYDPSGPKGTAAPELPVPFLNLNPL